MAGRARVILIGISLASLTALAYEGILQSQFVDYDDQVYVYNNEHVKSGMRLAGLLWAFSNNWAANWHPLTWVSHMLDCQIFGLNPTGHHLTSLILHILNTLLLFGVLTRMTGAVWKSGLVAALFAWHPLHVESAAWVSERKDLLSTFFALLAILSYHRYTTHPEEGLAQTILFFVFGLLSKPMVVTLPVLLLLLDYWPLQRMRKDGVPVGRRALQLVMEKKFLFLLSAGGSVAAFLAQRQDDAVISLEQLPIGLRLENSAVSYVLYLAKMVWPANLAVPYPRPASWPLVGWLGCAFLLVLITVIVITVARRCPYLVVGWLWYLLGLLPAIGLIQVGTQLMADRYTYVPLIGVFICVVWGFGDLLERRGPVMKAAFASVSLVILLGCLRLTAVQVSYWRNTTALFSHAIVATRDNSIAHRILGDALDSAGKTDEALGQYRAALAITPNDPWALFGMGSVLIRLGKTDQAIDRYRAAAACGVNYPKINWELGLALASQGEDQEAARQFFEVLRLDPAFEGARAHLAKSLLKLGRTDLASVQYARLEAESKSTKSSFKSPVILDSRRDAGGME